MNNLFGGGDDVPVQEQTIASHVLSFVGIAFMVMCFALFATSNWEHLPTIGRIGVGAGASLALLAIGKFLTSRSQNWLGASVTASGYALGYFFAFASYYVQGLSFVPHPVFSWVLQLGVALACTAHGLRNNILKWFAVPFTLGVGGHVLVQGLMNADVLQVAGLTVPVKALASITAVGWCAALSWLYKRLEERTPNWQLRSGETYATGLFYSIAHELYFTLAAGNALSLPFFCSSWGYTPLWWALEVPTLLLVCWRTQNYVSMLFKHGLVFAIALASLVSLCVVLGMGTQIFVPVFVASAVPAITTAVGLAYYFLHGRDLEENPLPVVGYCAYMYATPVAVFVAAFLTFGGSGGMMVLAVYSVALLVLSVWLHDSALYIFSILASIIAALVYVFHFFTWSPVEVIVFTAAAYSISLIYGLVVSDSNWLVAPFLKKVQAAVVIHAEDAELAAAIYGFAGFLIMTVGSYQLFSGPAITIAWTIEALVLTVGGLALKMAGHRLCGLLAFAASAGKLLIFDLSGASTGWRTLAFGIAGLCFLVGAYVYGNSRKTKAPPMVPTDSGDQPKA